MACISGKVICPKCGKKLTYHCPIKPGDECFRVIDQSTVSAEWFGYCTHLLVYFNCPHCGEYHHYYYSLDGKQLSQEEVRKIIEKGGKADELSQD